MSSGLFSIGTSALTAAYTALQTTGNNIANANTPGYSRQITNFTALVETGLSGNYIGQGVAVDSIKRAYSQLLTQQVNLAQSASSQSNTHAALLNQVNNLFSSTTGGLGAAVNQFFAQAQTLTQQPSSLAVRQTLLSSAQQMASSFNDAYGQLQLMQQGADQQIGQEISTVNTTSAKMGMGPDPSNPQNIVVGTQAGNTIIPLNVNSAGGGNIGALMQFRLHDIPTVENQIGRLAVVVSSQFNQQSKLGQDLNGAAGVNVFSTSSP